MLSPFSGATGRGLSPTRCCPDRVESERQKLAQDRVPLQKCWEVRFDVSHANTGHPVPHQLHRHGKFVAPLGNQRSEGIPEVMAGKASQTSAVHQIPDQLPHTVVTEPLIPPAFTSEHLLVVGQAVSQKGHQLSSLGRDRRPLVSLLPTA